MWEKIRSGFEAARLAHIERIAALNGSDDEKLLFVVERSFAKGKRWGQGRYEGDDGKRCLVGALRAMRAVHEIKGDRADQLLKQAIAEGQGAAPRAIETFNDSRRSYQEIAAVLGRARELANHSAGGCHVHGRRYDGCPLDLIEVGRARVTVRK